MSDDVCGFFDARCMNCGGRYGWSGGVMDGPDHCPHCAMDLAVQRQMRHEDAEAIGGLLNRCETPAAKCDGAKLRAKRIDNGLTLRQAAGLLDTTMTRLSYIEQGRATVNEVMAERMDRVYGGPKR